jgi:hypothetical protein
LLLHVFVWCNVMLWHSYTMRNDYINLINILITSNTYIFCGENVWILLSNLDIHSTYAILTLLCNTSQKRNSSCVIKISFYLTNIFSLPHLPASESASSLLCFCEFHCFKLHIEVTSTFLCLAFSLSIIVHKFVHSTNDTILFSFLLFFWFFEARSYYATQASQNLLCKQGWNWTKKIFLLQLWKCKD